MASPSRLSVRLASSLRVKRISVGGSIARAVLGLVRQAAIELREQGTVGYANGQVFVFDVPSNAWRGFDILASPAVVPEPSTFALLAGALGGPVWVLLPGIPLDWRWLVGRVAAPWYPRVTVACFLLFSASLVVWGMLSPALKNAPDIRDLDVYAEAHE